MKQQFQSGILRTSSLEMREPPDTDIFTYEGLFNVDSCNLSTLNRTLIPMMIGYHEFG
jgi:hypothetical protein